MALKPSVLLFSIRASCDTRATHPCERGSQISSTPPRSRLARASTLGIRFRRSDRRKHLPVLPPTERVLQTPRGDVGSFLGPQSSVSCDRFSALVSRVQPFLSNENRVDVDCALILASVACTEKYLPVVSGTKFPTLFPPALSGYRHASFPVVHALWFAWS
jgi:hypothetical protein